MKRCVILLIVVVGGVFPSATTAIVLPPHSEHLMTEETEIFHCPL